jgi:hypothetical protein
VPALLSLQVRRPNVLFLLADEWRVAADFFTVECGPGASYSGCIVLLFSELSTRNQIAGTAKEANGLWMSQIGRSLADVAGVRNDKR